MQLGLGLHSGSPPAWQLCQLCVSGGLGRLEAEHGDLIGPFPYLKEEEVCRQLKHKRGASVKRRRWDEACHGGLQLLQEGWRR